MRKLFLILLLLLQIPTTFGNNQEQDPSSKRIIGTWYNNQNHSLKWVFSQDGKVYNYVNNAFKVMYRYSISHSCQNNTSDDVEFLNLMDKDGDEFCFKIIGINENKNGILSLINLSNMEKLQFVNDLNINAGN